MDQINEKMYPRRKATWSDGDVLDLAVFRFFLAPWKKLFTQDIAGKSKGKRELFAELSQAVHHQVPLVDALELSCRSHGDYRYEVEIEEAKEDGETIVDRAPRKDNHQYGLGKLFKNNERYSSSGNNDPARKIAARLFPFVRSGVALSDAMKGCEGIFSREEIALVHAGESSGSLECALDRISRYQYEFTCMTVSREGSTMGFGSSVMSMFLLLSMLPFIVSVIRNMFVNLGLPYEESGPLRFLFMLDSMCGSGGVFFLTSLLFMIPVVGWMLSGVREALVLPVVLFSMMMFTLTAKMSIWKGIVDDRVLSFLQIVVFVLLMYLVPSIIFIPGKVGRWVFRKFRDYFCYIPGVRSLVLSRLEIVWLGIVQMGVSCGMPVDQAVQLASHSCEGAVSERSCRVEALVNKGVLLGRACCQEGLFRPHINQRLELLDKHPDMAGNLELLVQEAAEDYHELTRRYARFLEVAMVVTGGIIMGGMIIMVYYPLIRLPVLVVSQP